MSLDPKEPPGGDFVAYIDQLLRAQAVRQAKPVVAQAVGPAVPAPGSGGHAAKLTAAQAEAVAKAFSLMDAPVEACQYKRSDQVALFVSGLQEDGISRLSLEALGNLQTFPPRIGERTVRLDLRIGFAAHRKTDSSPEDMTGRAELLIEMQG